MITTHRRALRALCAMAGLATVLGLATGARAGITNIDVGYDLQYDQTGASTTALEGSFFASRVFLNNPGDFTSSTLTFGGAGSPVTLTPSGSILLYQTGFLADQAALEAAFPAGNYQFNTHAPGIDQVDFIAVGGTTFSSVIPALSAASYNSLQGLHAATSETLAFSGYTPAPGVNEADIFATITNSSGVVVFAGSLPSASAASLLLPANTLAANTAYNLDLDYSARVNGSDGNVATTVLSDVRTEVAFTTAAVPEPAAWALMVLGVGMTGVALRRRRDAALPI